MEEYRSNSHKSKDQPIKPETKKLVTDGVKIQEKQGLAKVASLLISDDISDIKTYIIMDILIPTIRDTIVDVITKGTEMIFCGKNGRSNRKPVVGSRTSYERYYEPSSYKREYERSEPQSLPENNYKNIIFDSRGDAEIVLEELRNYILQYDVARISDLYDFAGITHDYTKCNYGWSDLSKAYVYRASRGGYMLQLPRPLPIDN